MNTSFTTTHTIAAGAACKGINHVLSSEPWASAELVKHSGKTVFLELPLGKMFFEINSIGFLAAIKEVDDPSLTLQITAKAFSDLISSPGNLREQAFKAVKITGDADLAQLIGRLAGQLRWEYEEDLARLVGDVPATLAVRGGKRFILATRTAASDLIDNIVEYVSEERKVLLSQRDFMVHKAELNNLRDSIDRLEKRIQFLEQKAK